jgi:replicative DNA helicase
MYWLQFADFYSFPHVILFDSWAHLAAKLESVDFAEVSSKMCDYNAKELTRIAAQWEEVLGKVQQSSSTKESSYAQAMDAVYGVAQWAEY